MRSKRKATFLTFLEGRQKLHKAHRPPGPFHFSCCRNISSNGETCTLVQDIALSEDRSVMRQNLWLQKMKNKKGGVSGTAVRRSLQRTTIISTHAGFSQICWTDYYIGGHCVHSKAHTAQYFPSILREVLPSFLMLTRGMKAHVFLRPNSELHKSQATTDSQCHRCWSTAASTRCALFSVFKGLILFPPG